MPYVVSQMDRTFYVITGELQEHIDSKGQITSLEDVTGFHYKVGSEVLLQYNKLVRIGAIERVNPNRGQAWRLYSHRYTMSREMILPIFKHIYEHDFGHGMYLANLYLADTKYYTEFGDQVMFLLRQTGEIKFSKLDTQLISMKGYQGSFEPDRYFKMYSYDKPELIDRIWEPLLQGEYSKFDPEIKRIIIKQQIGDHKKQYWQAVFSKSEVLRQVLSDHIGTQIPRGNELRSKMDPTVETYDHTRDTCHLDPDIKPDDPFDAFGPPNDLNLPDQKGGRFSV